VGSLSGRPPVTGATPGVSLLLQEAVVGALMLAIARAQNGGSPVTLEQLEQLIDDLQEQLENIMEEF